MPAQVEGVAEMGDPGLLGGVGALVDAAPASEQCMYRWHVIKSVCCAAGGGQAGRQLYPVRVRSRVH